ncbi:MAG: Spy/CpxP family protein refolding chaperone [Usitatibacter sp.]
MRKSLLAAAVAAGLLVSGAVLPEPYGMGGGYGPGGYGMGPGMMGAAGPGYGMGPGFMGGHGLANLDLTAEQRTKIEGIQHDFEHRQWKLMEGMRELMWQQRDTSAGGKFDEKSARQAYDAREQLHKQMFENSLEARKQIDAVLTPEQRQKLGRSAG